MPAHAVQALRKFTKHHIYLAGIVDDWANLFSTEI